MVKFLKKKNTININLKKNLANQLSKLTFLVLVMNIFKKTLIDLYTIIIIKKNFIKSYISLKNIFKN